MMNKCANMSDVSNEESRGAKERNAINFSSVFYRHSFFFLPVIVLRMIHSLSELSISFFLPIPLLYLYISEKSEMKKSFEKGFERVVDRRRSRRTEASEKGKGNLIGDVDDDNLKRKDAVWSEYGRCEIYFNCLFQGSRETFLPKK